VVDNKRPLRLSRQ